MAVRVAVHQPLPDSTWDNWLDSTPDLSSVNSTQDHGVDVEHQPTDLAVGGSNPSRRAKHAGQSLYPSLIYLHCCGSPVNDLQILTRVVRWIEGSDRPWPASRGCGYRLSRSRSLLVSRSSMYGSSSGGWPAAMARLRSSSAFSSAPS